MDPRVLLIRSWVKLELGWRLERIELASADASFRRYFRIWSGSGETRIVMDAPPDKEDIAPYVRVTRLLAACDVHVPRIDAVDAGRGLILLEDLGSTHMLAALQGGADPSRLYAEAMDPLARIQQRGGPGAATLPAYDAGLLGREMALCPEWFCERHLGLKLDASDAGLLAASCDFLVREALAQPSVLVHRDYHSRNLMCLEQGGPGIIDFQDAVAGPVSYDLVSLLKDCYIAWPRERVEEWVAGYRRGLGPVLAGASDAEFLRWFDLVGLQRHIKVLGIFARLWYRDGKSGYLADLPRVLDYVRDTAGRYHELAGFSVWVAGRLLPQLAAANARELESVAAGGSS